MTTGAYEDPLDYEDLENSGNFIYLCGLKIDIEMIEKKELLKLRKLFPKDEYM